MAVVFYPPTVSAAAARSVVVNFESMPMTTTSSPTTTTQSFSSLLSRQSRGRSRRRRTAVGAGEAAAHGTDANPDSNAGVALKLRIWSVNGAAGRRCQKRQRGGGVKGDRYCDHLVQTITIVAAEGGGTDSGITTELIADT